jgi:hypothetical protein
VGLSDAEAEAPAAATLVDVSFFHIALVPVSTWPTFNVHVISMNDIKDLNGATSIFRVRVHQVGEGLV